MTPEEIVQAQLDAYNARDMEGFLARYHEDAEICVFPATVAARGREAIRARYAERFADASLHANLLSRIVMDHVVVDREHVTTQHFDGLRHIDAIAVYEVRGGKIERMTGIYGAQPPFPAAVARSASSPKACS